MTTVSVIIPTFKRRDVTAACIASLLEQSRLPDEIVLVDDSPGDQIRSLVDELGDRDLQVPVRFIANPGRASLTRARNVGVQETDSDIVVFFDSDSLVDRHFIEFALETLAAHPDAMAVRGIEDNRRPYPPLYRLYRWFLLQPIIGHTTIRIGTPPTFTRYGTDIRFVRRSDSMKGSNMVIRREAFEKVGFEDQMERYSLLEDIDFALSLRRAFGECIYVDPRMRIDHVVHEAGRIPDEDLWLMLYFHKHFITHKHRRVGPWMRFRLWWSDVGFLTIHSHTSLRRLRELWPWHRRAKQLLRRHRDDLRAGRLDALNQYFSWMDGPDHGL